MHEMSLVRKVVDMVLDECEGRDVIKVSLVHLTIGDMYDVVEEFVPGLFRHLARGTVAEDAEVVITRMPITAICSKCGFVILVDVHDESTWECPQCHARGDYRLNTGREFFIDSIEVEVSATVDKKAHSYAPDTEESEGS